MQLMKTSSAAGRVHVQRCNLVAVAPRLRPSAAANNNSNQAASKLDYKHLLLAILDANPYLSDGSRTAVAAAVDMSRAFGSAKVTVLVVDEPGTDNTDPAKRLESINWHLAERGCLTYEVMERATKQPASVLLGDVADEIAADMVMLSSEAVHAKHVDANQLAEFLSCPVLLLP